MLRRAHPGQRSSSEACGGADMGTLIAGWRHRGLLVTSGEYTDGSQLSIGRRYLWRGGLGGER